MKKDVADMLPQYAADLAHHVLVPITETGQVKVWRMKRPGAGSMYMVEIIVTSLGIIIHGDQHPTAQPVHARNGLGWFVSQLDSGYNAHLSAMVSHCFTFSPTVPMEVRARALPMFPVEVALPAHGVKVLMRRGDWFVVANRQPGNSERSPMGRWSWPAGDAAEISERIEKGDRWCHLMEDLPPCATEPSAARTDTEKETT